MCKCLDLCIVNGRFGSDKNIGSTTCANKSTIDYVICTPDLLPNLTNFTVDTFDPLMSDKHNPIYVNLNLAKSLHTNPINTVTDNKTENISNKKQAKCKWDNSKKEAYQNNFDMNKIYDMSINLSTFNKSEATQATVDKITQNLKNIATDPAKSTGMFKHVIPNTKIRKSKYNKPWFNTLCKNSKDNYKKLKKSLPDHQTDDNKAVLNKFAKKHNKLIRREKRKFDKDFNAKLKSLKASDPGEYWKIINQGKKKTESAIYHSTSWLITSKN